MGDPRKRPTVSEARLVAIFRAMPLFFGDVILPLSISPTGVQLPLSIWKIRASVTCAATITAHSIYMPAGRARRWVCYASHAKCACVYSPAVIVVVFYIHPHTCTYWRNDPVSATRVSKKEAHAARSSDKRTFVVNACDWCTQNFKQIPVTHLYIAVKPCRFVLSGRQTIHVSL